jgi:tRNA threonylcarbamoyladenosine biosynthesis protein TsaB
VRILALETSSLRGSVALVEDGTLIRGIEHQRENAHGESMLPLIERAFADTGWRRGDVDRVAVGIGPGSFTGLRVGIALALGLSEGWDVPLVGVPSLQAIALAAPPERAGCRCVLLDARKGELFAAVYAPDGRELVPVQLVPVALAEVRRLAADEAAIYLGNGTVLLPELPDVHRSPETDTPHARWVAAAARSAMPSPMLGALYVRDAGAVRPVLPENPLAR